VDLLLQVTLTPSEGKRLIGKAVAALEPVQTALREGTIIITTGTTNAYVFEELMGKKIEDKGLFTAGVVTAKGCGLTVPEKRYKHQVIVKGKVTEMETPELPKVLREMGPNDVFIKGANAIDPYGSAAVMLSGGAGGTMGACWGYISANGIKFVIPVGLEKLVPCSLIEAAQRTGNKRVDKAPGLGVGLMVVAGEIITEIEAFNLLTGVEAIPIGGGGIDGGEGSRTFIIQGDEASIELCEATVKAIKGEPPLKTTTQS
jgi:hypothetical protein